MPTTCCIMNCGSRGDRDIVKFFQIPSVLNFIHRKDLNDISKRRHEKWLRTIERGDMTEAKLKYSKVCSKHFVSGKPSHLKDESNVDWAPTLLLGHEEETVLKKYKLATDGRERAEKRKRLEETSEETYVSNEERIIEFANEPGMEAETNSGDNLSKSMNNSAKPK